MGFRSTLAICVSVALHAATITLLSGAQAADRAVEGPDVWRGDTVDIEPLLTRAAETRPARPANAAPPPTEASPAEPAPPRAKPKPPPVVEPEATAPPDAPPDPQSESPKPPSPEPPSPEPPAVAKAAAPLVASATQPPTTAASPSQPPTPAPTGSAGSAETANGGASDLPAGVRRLDKAFVRAITAATHRDPYWRSAPAGSVGSARIRLSVDADGKLGEMVTEPREAGAAIGRVLTRTALMLKSGRFALPQGQGAGVVQIELEIVLSDGAATEDADDPTATVTMGFTPPTHTKAGRAYFSLASGRRFEATVRLRE